MRICPILRVLSIGELQITDGGSDGFLISPSRGWIWGQLRLSRVGGTIHGSWGRWVLRGSGLGRKCASKTAKTRETRLNEKLFWPRAQPKCARGQPQAISDRPRGQARRYATKKRGSTTFRVWPFRSQLPRRSMRSPTRCEHPPITKPVRAVRWVCPEPRGRLRPLKTLEIIAPRRPHRGRRGTN